MTWIHPWADFVLDRSDGTPVVVVPSALTEPVAVRGMFSQHPTGIAAICAEVEGVPNGMVVTSLSVGASFEPPFVVFSAQQTSRTWERLSTAARIGVSVLAEENAESVVRIASRRGDRFADTAIARSPDGAVFIVGARLWLDCRPVSQLPLGDHTLVVLEVVGASSRQGAVPLVYHDGEVVGAGPVIRSRE